MLIYDSMFRLNAHIAHSYLVINIIYYANYGQPTLDN